MSCKVACIGVGMTRFVRRAKESSGELAAQAVEMALRDAGMTIDEIDSVCLGSAPDAFDGVHMKGEHLIAGTGGTHKPYMRHFVGGATGIMTPIHGWMHVASGKFNSCLVVCEEKMSPCVPHPAGAFITIFDRVTEQPLKLTLIHIFALEMRRFMHVYGYTEEDFARISVLLKSNALGHPAAQLTQEVTVKDVMESPVLSWPVKRLDISPTSDGAVAMVLVNERIARARSPAPVFIEGVGFRLDTAFWCSRDLAYPNYVAMAAEDAYRMAGITDPAREIDFFEPYDPFDYKALHHMNALLLDKSGRKVKDLFLSGAFEPTGSHPLCPSGGALGVGNPIAATGLMKIAELYFQLSGQAGARQIQRPLRRGVAQAWGDLMQVGTVVVMGSDGAAPGRKSMWIGIRAEDLPGTALKSPDDAPSVVDEPDLRYAWDNGQGVTTYLHGLKAGKLRGSYCRRTSRMLIPPRTFSEIANIDPVTDVYDLPDTGTVMTYTVSYVNWDSSPLPEGQTNIFAVIAIDGAGDHTGLVHLLRDVDPKDVYCGMRVRAVWKDAAERTGSILDIKYFAPLKDETPAAEPRRVKPPELTSATAGYTTGKIPLTYRYTVGVAGTQFYNDLAGGEIKASVTRDGSLILPPAMFDEETMTLIEPGRLAPLDPGSGFIRAFTEVHEDRAGHPLDRPAVIVQVAFGGVRGSVFGRLDLRDGEEPFEGHQVELVRPDKLDGPDQITFRLKA